MTALALRTPAISRLATGLDVVDFFCGMGGSSSGLREAGYTVKLAANHWQRAITTHAANHPDTEHLCADIQALDLRRLPRARVLWASPICTELSPAGGRSKKPCRSDRYEDQGHVENAAFERTRVTFWEIVRATELFSYDAIIVENVVEAADWSLFNIWLMAMTTLGYSHQFLSVSAAHLWSDDSAPAPQWRDRLYIVFVKHGIRQPDLDPRPLAWCEACNSDVPARQWWKPSNRHQGRRIGKYGPQYLYECPEGHGIIEPYTAPATAAIDWTNLGTRIGDRKRPLSAATMRRIQVGVDTIGNPALVAAAGNTYDGAAGAPNSYVRAWPATTSPTPAQTGTAQLGIASGPEFVFSVTHGANDTGRHFNPHARPLPTATVRAGEALVVPAGGTWNTEARSALDQPHRTMLTRDAYALAMTEPFVTMLRNHATVTGINDPLATFSAGGFHHGLTIPGAFIQKHHGGLDYAPIGHMLKSVDEPLPTTVARPNLSLVIPYRKGAQPHSPNRPISALATHAQHGLLSEISPVNVEDCYFRMLTPREAANAQRFVHDYVITGNQGEQQMQAGNAVAVNVARWIGERVAEALDEAA